MQENTTQAFIRGLRKGRLMDVIETVNEHCKHEDCMYRMALDSTTDYCAFCLIEKEMRRYSISKCKRYKRGSKRVTIDGGTLAYRWIMTDEDE